jgi:Bacterial Ig-like domain (group 2)
MSSSTPHHHHRRALLCGALFLGLWACSDRVTGPALPVVPASPTLAPTQLEVGEHVYAQAMFVNDSSSGADAATAYRLVSSNQRVAAALDDGTIVALDTGLTTITMTSGSGQSSAPLRVTLAATGGPSVAVTIDSASIAVGGSAKATAVVRDATGRILRNRTITWSTSAGTVATVTSLGRLRGEGAGTAAIAATYRTATGSATITVRSAVTPQQPPPAALGVEPLGLGVLTSRPFSAQVEDGWTMPTWAAPYFTIMQDAGAPKSPGGVGQIRFPAGFSGGDSPALVERDLGSTARTVYISMWIKLSSNWVGHLTGTNKVLHLWINGGNRVFAYADGGGTAPLAPSIGLQGIAGAYADGRGNVSTSVNLLPNVAGQTGVQLARGRWHRWELVLVSNTNGATGSADWWIDGVQVGHYTGIPYVPSGAAGTWDLVKWDPTWGGLGGTIPADQTMSMDDLYISGKP